MPITDRSGIPLVRPAGRAPRDAPRASTRAVVWCSRGTRAIARTSWVRAFGELLVDGDLERPYDNYYDVDYAAIVAADGGYSPVEVFEVEWEQLFDPELLGARAPRRSASSERCPSTSEPRSLERVRNLTQTHPGSGRSRGLRLSVHHACVLVLPQLTDRTERVLAWADGVAARPAVARGLATRGPSSSRS